jgi:hypothetical protein
MQQYILVLLGIVVTAALWVLFQIWLQRQDPAAAQKKADFLCQDCDEPCGKQIKW